MDLREAERKYHEARDNVDSLIRRHSDQINTHLVQIAKYRTMLMYQLLRRWEKSLTTIVPDYKSYIDTGEGMLRRLGKAYADYIRYAFYLRFANGLQRNIKFRKILSFEIHFMIKREVLKFLPDAQPTIPPGATDIVALFYASPLMHFMNFRLLTELRIRTTTDAWELYENVTAVQRLAELSTAEMLKFSRRHAAGSAVPKLDAFREFVPDTDLEGIIEFIDEHETFPTL